MLDLEHAVTFTKAADGKWQEQGTLPPGCHSVHMQFLADDDTWKPPERSFCTFAPFRPSRLREIIHDPGAPKSWECYRMIPVTNTEEETDMTTKKTKTKKAATTSKAKTKRAAKPAKVTKTKKGATTPRENKGTAILALLRRPEGATIEDLMGATGWQQHSIRGFLAGVVRKKMGLDLASEKPKEGKRVYKVAS